MRCKKKNMNRGKFKNALKSLCADINIYTSQMKWKRIYSYLPELPR